MKKRFMLPALLIIILCSFSASSLVRDEKNERSGKELSAKDKEVIIGIFKTLSEDQYRFEFSKDENYGMKVLPKAMWYSLRSGNKETFAGSIVQNYYPAINFWYVINNPKSPGQGIEDVFGKANAARLQAIINKYSGGQ